MPVRWRGEQEKKKNARGENSRTSASRVSSYFLHFFYDRGEENRKGEIFPLFFLSSKLKCFSFVDFIAMNGQEL